MEDNPSGSKSEFIPGLEHESDSRGSDFNADSRESDEVVIVHVLDVSPGSNPHNTRRQVVSSHNLPSFKSYRQNTASLLIHIYFMTPKPGCKCNE